MKCEMGWRLKKAWRVSLVHCTSFLLYISIKVYLISLLIHFMRFLFFSYSQYSTLRNVKLVRQNTCKTCFGKFIPKKKQKKWFSFPHQFSKGKKYKKNIVNKYYVTRYFRSHFVYRKGLKFCLRFVCLFVFVVSLLKIAWEYF